VTERVFAQHTRWASGYTLIELVTCLIIVAILGAVIAPKMFSYQPFQQRGYADEVAAALHYTQDVAVSSGCDASITVNAGGYQALQRAAVGNNCAPAGGWVTPVLAVDGGPVSGSAPSGVVASPSHQFVFDSTGRVTNGAPPPLGLGSFTLTVDAGSGLVSVQ
jgi:prepilin-type N-terminal cleavage/methylation domain-containing protein